MRRGRAGRWRGGGRGGGGGGRGELPADGDGLVDGVECFFPPAQVGQEDRLVGQGCGEVGQEGGGAGVGGGAGGVAASCRRMVTAWSMASSASSRRPRSARKTDWLVRDAARSGRKVAGRGSGGGRGGSRRAAGGW